MKKMDGQTHRDTSNKIHNNYATLTKILCYAEDVHHITT